MPEPTVCRFVVYHHPDGFDCAAVISMVEEDGSTMLTVFRPFRVEWKRADEGTEVGSWSWPVIK